MKIITTNYNENKYWQESTGIQTEVGCMHVLNVYPEAIKEEIEGFGGAFTESSGYNYSNLSKQGQKELVEAYFSEEGLKYNLGRSHINSCDFALSNYAAVTEEGDKDFEGFTLEREEQYILPLIQDALQEAKGGIEFLFSPWSPPAYMKTNGDMNHGGKLKKEHYITWAKYLVKYLTEMKKREIQVEYITVQNEPEATQTWDSCRYSAEEEMIFVRDYLAPSLKEAGLDNVKILVWDHNKEILYERATAILEDKQARESIYGLGIHWYTGDHFEAVSMVKEKYPEQKIFFTEGCVEYSRFMDSSEIKKAEMYAHDMIGNFKHGLSAFFDWNLLLDSEGGPNHVKNYCAAPIMCTEDGKNIQKRLSYYYIGHFSRYIKKGAKSIGITRYTDQIQACGFLNPDGERVLVIMNETDQVKPVTIREYGKGCDIEIQPHSIVTVCYEIKK